MARLGTRGCGHLHLDLPAGRFDLGAGGRRNGHAAHRVGPIGVAGGEELDRDVSLADEAGGEQRLRGHVVAATFFSCAEVDRLGRDLEGIGEPSLRQPAVHRRLAASKTGIGLAAGAGLVTLVTLAGRLAETGAGPRPTRLRDRVDPGPASGSQRICIDSLSSSHHSSYAGVTSTR